MQYRCSQCHHAFSAEGEPAPCPNCRAEIGMEAVTGVPPAMRMFAFLLLGAIVAATTGGLVSRFVG